MTVLRDSLTGAWLRHTLDAQLQHWMEKSRQTAKPLSLLVVDVDHLKLINDAFGHLSGDAALVQVARCLRQHMHANEQLFRYGGDEFVLLLPNISEEQAHERAQQMLESVVQQPLRVPLSNMSASNSNYQTSPALSGNTSSDEVANNPAEDRQRDASRETPLAQRSIQLSLSIGVASYAYDDACEDAQRLFARADARAYGAKRSGRGQVHSQDSHDSAGYHEDMRLLGREDSLAALRHFLHHAYDAATAPVPARVPASAIANSANSSAFEAAEDLLVTRKVPALKVQGREGVGLSGILRYARTFAEVLGDVVVYVQATSALQTRLLGAVSEASSTAPWLTWHMLCQEDLLLQCWHEQAVASRLVIILDRVELLDYASVEALQHVLVAALPSVLIYSVSKHHSEADEEWRQLIDVQQTLTIMPLRLDDVQRWLQASLPHNYAQHVASALQHSSQLELPDSTAPTAARNWLQGVYNLSQGLPVRLHWLRRVLEWGFVTAEATATEQLEQLQHLWHSHGQRFQLPVSRSLFVGRYQDMAHLKAQLRSGKLLSIVGAGGAGKSRLALQLAKESQVRFWAVYWIDASLLTDYGQLLRAVAEVMHVPVGSVQDPKAPLFQALQRAPTLLVIDGFSHSPGALEALHTLQQYAAQTSLLITASEALKLSSEQAFVLQGFQAPRRYGQAGDLLHNSSLALFLEYARRAAPNQIFSSHDPALFEALQSIHHAVAGMPLGLELAAAWCSTYSPQTIAAMLQDNALSLNSAPTDGIKHDINPETRLQAMFEALWQLLSSYEQQVLASLSLFPSHFSEVAARAVADASPFFLSSMWHKSFLSHKSDGEGAGHYSMPLLLRQFAKAKLLAEPNWRQQAQRALVHYYVSWLLELEPTLWDDEQKRSFSRIHQDIDTIDEAWRLWAQQGTDEAVALDPEGKATMMLRNYYETSGHAKRGAVLFSQLAYAFEHKHARFTSFQAYAAARLWSRAGDLERSQQAAQQTHEALKRCAHSPQQAFSESAWLYALEAQNNLRQGLYQQVLPLLDTSWQEFGQLGLLRGQMFVLVVRATWYWQQDMPEKAAALWQQAETQSRSISARIELCRALYFQGMLHTDLSQWQRAEHCFHTCLELANIIGFERASAVSHIGLARCALRSQGIGFALDVQGDQGDTSAVATAKEQLQQALTYAERNGAMLELLQALAALASLMYATKEFSQDYLERALLLAQDSMYIPNVLDCLALYALYHPQTQGRIIPIIYTHSCASLRQQRRWREAFSPLHSSMPHAVTQVRGRLGELCTWVLEQLHSSSQAPVRSA